MFLFLFVWALLNIGALLTHFYEFTWPVNPIVFGPLALLAAVVSRGRRWTSPLIWATVFIVGYTTLGFFGDERVATDYEVARNIGKIGIVLVGYPWLANRVFRREDYVFYLKAAQAIGVFAVCVSLVQYVYPEWMFNLSSGGPERPAALWMNPNAAGQMFVLLFFLALVIPHEVPAMNIAIRGVLILGVLLTFSRSAAFALVLGILVYCAVGRKVSNLYLVVLFCVASALLFSAINADVTEDRYTRVGGIVQAFRGDLSGIRKLDTRTEVWEESLRVASNHVVLGGGHGSMARAVEIGGRMADPHNLYIWILGNSGLLALVLFVCFLVACFRDTMKVQNVNARSALAAAYTALAVGFLFSDRAAFHQHYAPVLCLLFVSSRVWVGSTRARVKAARPESQRGLRVDS